MSCVDGVNVGDDLSVVVVTRGDVYTVGQGKYSTPNYSVCRLSIIYYLLLGALEREKRSNLFVQRSDGHLVCVGFQYLVVLQLTLTPLDAPGAVSSVEIKLLYE